MNTTTIRCDICPRACRLKDGERGFCLVRVRHGSEVVLKPYAYNSGIALDPIEKKPLHHFLPGTSVLSLGTIGCNLACRFCQNWNISKKESHPEDRMQHTSAEEIVRMALEQGASSIAYTYNDPVTWFEYVLEIAELAREAGLASVAVSAGYATEKTRKLLFSAMDAANIDLKAFTDNFYRTMTSGRIQPVLDTIQYIANLPNTHLEITNLMIPGLNDSPEETRALSEWVFNNAGRDTPLHFSGFTPHYKLMHTPPTPTETLLRARDIARSVGLRYVYIGNRHSANGSNTHCPSCGALLIERDGYSIRRNRISEGKCPQCGCSISGTFSLAIGH